MSFLLLSASSDSFTLGKITTSALSSSHREIASLCRRRAEYSLPRHSRRPGLATIQDAPPPEPIQTTPAHFVLPHKAAEENGDRRVPDPEGHNGELHGGRDGPGRAGVGLWENLMPRRSHLNENYYTIFYYSMVSSFCHGYKHLIAVKNYGRNCNVHWVVSSSCRSWMACEHGKSLAKLCRL
jgi:hypothetical protein